MGSFTFQNWSLCGALAKTEAFLYNEVLSKRKNVLCGKRGRKALQNGERMFNIYSKKSKRIISSVIIIILVLAMVVPTLIYVL